MHLGKRTWNWSFAVIRRTQSDSESRRPGAAGGMTQRTLTVTSDSEARPGTVTLPGASTSESETGGAACVCSCPLDLIAASEISPAHTGPSGPSVGVSPPGAKLWLPL
jgi:hypothetical protein